MEKFWAMYPFHLERQVLFYTVRCRTFEKDDRVHFTKCVNKLFFFVTILVAES
jgi:hypothetical protein